jgi:hypothetical protein
MRAILKANAEQGDVVHNGLEQEPDRVRLDERERPVFLYPEVGYTYDRELDVVLEDRPGVHAAYTSRGTVAYATSTIYGAEPLALALARKPPTCARWN